MDFLLEGDATADENRGSVPLLSLPAKRAEKAIKRQKFLDEMARLSFENWHAVSNGNDKSPFEQALIQASDIAGYSRPVSKSTYYEWLRIMIQADHDIAALGGKAYPGHCQIDRRASELIDSSINDIIEAAQLTNLARKPLTPGDVVAYCRNAIKKANEAIDVENKASLARGDGALALIAEPSSKSTYYDRWKNVPAFKRALVEKGPQATRADFRGGRGLILPEACLDLVEYDETRLNFFVYDDAFSVPLGRAWLSWFLCTVSELPLGIYLGFEEVSDISLTAALRNSCLPKTYLSKQIPAFEDYSVFGIPRSMVFDNPFSQHGNTIEAITRDLRSSHQFAPSHTPWFKGRVESSFNVLNQTLLRELPGYIPPGGDVLDYDPAQNAAISLQSLYALVWRWIYHYACQPHSVAGIPRLEFWKNNTSNFPPSLVDRKKNLDELFWVVRGGKREIRKMDHRGVHYEKLRYFSDELQSLRVEEGDNASVTVKVNPSDLEYILVRVRAEAPWVRVRSVDPAYTRGLSLHVHKLCLSAARERFGAEHVDCLKRAKGELAYGIADAVTASKSISTNSMVAKILGLGSQHLSNRIDHDGRLTSHGVDNPPSAAPAIEKGPSPFGNDVDEPLPTFESDLSLRPGNGE